MASSDSAPAQSQFSCNPCRLRKVKCNRQIPCIQCVRVSIECEQAARKPYPKRKRQSEQLELRQREKSARSEQSEAEACRSATHTATATPDKSHLSPQEGAPAFGQSLWTGLQENVFREPRPVETPRQPEPSTGGQPLDLFGGLLGLTADTNSLKSAYPQPVHAFTLWQTYLQGVNPLSKIIYAPQVQDLVVQAAGDFNSLSLSDVALLLSIYAAAVSALSDESCTSKLGEPKKILLDRYLTCTLQALAATKFLQSTSLVLLQAFVIFIIAARQTYSADSIWIFSGMAVRIGQRLLSAAPSKTCSEFFETQMRLRVWWQILLIDGRMSQLVGQARTLAGDVPQQPLPANLNDSDINPRMTGAPPILDRPTEMVFCLLRYEMGQFLFTKGKALHDQTVTIAQRDAVIDDIAETFQTKFLQHLDLAIPLHQIAAAGAHAAVDKMRLMVHHPGQYADKGASMAQAEHDMLFRTSMSMVQTLVDGFTATHLDHFKWHIDVYFQLDAVVFMLIESQTQPADSPLVDRAWELVGSVLEHKKHLVRDQDELGRAVRQLVLRTWDARQQQAFSKRMPITWTAPKAVVDILPAQSRDALPTPASAESNSGMQSDLSDLDGLTDVAFVDIDVLGWETTDWNSWDNWNNLFQAQG